MTQHTVVVLHAPERCSPDPLADLRRQGAWEVIEPAVKAEVIGVLATPADQTDPAGRRRLVRQGRLPERDGLTGIGALPVKVPRVRHRAPACAPLARWNWVA